MNKEKLEKLKESLHEIKLQLPLLTDEQRLGLLEFFIDSYCLDCGCITSNGRKCESCIICDNDE